MSEALSVPEVSSTLAKNTSAHPVEVSNVATLANMVGGLIVVLAIIFLLSD